eukprot:1149346-Amorphochlora_amoeboformis.AAC.1
MEGKGLVRGGDLSLPVGVCVDVHAGTCTHRYGWVWSTCTHRYAWVTERSIITESMYGGTGRIMPYS